MQINDSIFLGSALPEMLDDTLVIQQNKRLLFLSLLGNLIEIIVHGTSPLSLPDAIADSLEYLKAFGGTEQRNLPSGYTQLEYIESTGTQYIDTGYTFTLGNKLELVINPLNDNNAMFFGANSNGSELFLRKNNAYFGGNQLNGLFPTTDTIYDVVMDLDSQNASLAINNTSKFQGAASFNGKTIYLFAATGSYNLDVPTNYVNVRIYNFKITQNSTLVRNLIPCKRNSDNVLGMYDTVSGTFLTNAGSGTFAAGGEAVPTPDTPMDIVSNNGVLKASRNLFDKNDIKTGGYFKTSNGEWTSANGFNSSGFIPVTAGQKYVKQGELFSGSNSCVFYDANKNYISAPNAYFGSNQTVTVPSGAAYMRVLVRNDYLDTLQVEQGETATPYTPYSPTGIYADGTVETINVHGKNLFDRATVTNGYYISATGEIVANEASMYSDYIKVKPSTTYTISLISGSSGNAVRVHSYTSDKNWIEQLSETITGAEGSSYSATFTTSSNAEYVRFGCRQAQTDIQIEQGATATDYVPYFDGGTATAEMLLKVGDYQDVQSIIDGVVTRNVGVKVLDGSEDCVIVSNMLRIKCPLSIANPTGWQQLRYCTHGECGVANSSNKYIEIDGQNVYFGGYWTGITWTTAEEGKTFLANQYANGTPVIIVYPLATPTTESVAGQTMQVQAGDNTLEITQASLDNLELEAKYKAAVSLTIQEVQDANLDPNVQVTIN